MVSAVSGTLFSKTLEVNTVACFSLGAVRLLKQQNNSVEKLMSSNAVPCLLAIPWEISVSQDGNYPVEEMDVIVYGLIE